MRVSDKKDRDADEVSSEDLSRQSGESYNTIDYWSERRLLKFRRVGRKRLYSLKINLPRIRLIRDLQNKGHSIVTILERIDGQPASI